MLNAAATFTDTLGISTKYWIDSSSVGGTLTQADQTITPGNASVIFISNSDPSFSIQTISGGVEGRVLHFCNVVGSSPWLFDSGGNMAAISGSIGSGICSTLVYHGSTWYYFD
jgi:hypothetical protein